MKALQYFGHEDRDTIEHEVFKECYANPVMNVLERVPTILHFEASDESKYMGMLYPSKVSEIVHCNLIVFKEREWNAVITFADDGFVHVFFGKNEGQINYPPVWADKIIGSC